ncbi:MAG: hypothetical protein KC457_29000 [Myxococcales bacterium]|nr:hypothetical protein [Myxococcales bacterium]
MSRKQRPTAPPVAFELRPAERVVCVPKPTARDPHARFEIRIPAMLGRIDQVEQHHDFLVIRTAAAKLSYHLAPASRVGYLVWNSLRKTIKELCLVPTFARQVDMHVLYYRNGMVASGSGSSAVGVSGRVTLDGKVLTESNDLGFALGNRLEHYLHLDPLERMNADDRLIRAFALLDRETQTMVVTQRSGDEEDPIWSAFRSLRESG